MNAKHAVWGLGYLVGCAGGSDDSVDSDADTDAVAAVAVTAGDYALTAADDGSTDCTGEGAPETDFIEDLFFVVDSSWDTAFSGTAGFNDEFSFSYDCTQTGSGFACESSVFESPMGDTTSVFWSFTATGSVIDESTLEGSLALLRECEGDLCEQVDIQAACTTTQGFSATLE